MEIQEQGHNKIDMSQGFIKPSASDKGDKVEVGLPFRLKEGVIYVDAYNPDNKTEYIVDKQGNIVNKDKRQPIVFREFLILKRKV